MIPIKIQRFNEWDTLGTPNPLFFFDLNCYAQDQKIYFTLTLMGIGFRIVFGDPEASDYYYDTEADWLRAEWDRRNEEIEAWRVEMAQVISSSKRQKVNDGHYYVMYTKEALDEVDRLIQSHPGMGECPINESH